MDGLTRIPETSELGAWRWVLLILLGLERWACLSLLGIDDTWRNVGLWEHQFNTIWGWTGVAIIPLLIMKKRVAGWAVAISSLALLVRISIPLVSEDPASGAVVALFPIALSLTFAFLYDQSFWQKEHQS